MAVRTSVSDVIMDVASDEFSKRLHSGAQPAPGAHF